MLSLLLRNLLFTILQPGLVAGLFPYLILKFEGKNLLPDTWAVWQFAGITGMLFGFLALMACILRFAMEGRGTLSPFDPTKKLVIRGLYRYSRNPMYVGVVSLLLSEALFWQSFLLAGYTAAVFLVFNLFIHLHEEPRLRRDFGMEYEGYLQKVRRWL